MAGVETIVPLQLLKHFGFDVVKVVRHVIILDGRSERLQLTFFVTLTLLLCLPGLPGDIGWPSLVTSVGLGRQKCSGGGRASGWCRSWV